MRHHDKLAEVQQKVEDTLMAKRVFEHYFNEAVRLRREVANVEHLRDAAWEDYRVLSAQAAQQFEEFTELLLRGER